MGGRDHWDGRHVTVADLDGDLTPVPHPADENLWSIALTLANRPQAPRERHLPCHRFRRRSSPATLAAGDG